MRILIAPDKFKGTLTGAEAAKAMAAGIRRVLPDAEISVQPIADGGEGTLEAVLAAGGERRETRVRGPLKDAVTAPWALTGTTAVIETARASGLEFITPTSEAAGNAHCYGSGELLAAALDAGASEIVLGVGGSAMSDGGSGALRALGARVLDDDGAELPLGGLALARASSLDLSGLDSRLEGVQLRIAVDVQNPLCGPDGAAHIFGAQKGADAPLRNALDAALSRWAQVLLDATGVDVQQPGAGAAGGFPAAFLACTRASLEPGFDLVAGLTGLDRKLAETDLVFTGEGSLDAQSAFGKAPLGLAERARNLGLPVLAVAGRITLSDSELSAHGVVGARSLADTAPSVSAAMTDAWRYAADAAETVLKAHLSTH
ncbi:glycerate kinase [Arthrobacter subterraneus]|uniref:Glycerate kinase n=1 Tax=Arthrobacter subterraneus TaxID=335973 RepID=A0A1G8K1F3_9MICC|nr:glycerate kinase [Arthrobacter subterraneus]SDI37282.1 glycerate kinase [Arthrobacter subterraneus]